LISYTPDLRQYNFDNLAVSCCFNGIWVLYDDYNYNVNNFQVLSSIKPKRHLVELLIFV
jgi:hypothetical protein